MRFKVYYWPVSFRECFLTYTLSYLDIPFLRAPTDHLLEMKSVPFSEQPVPFMGPPVLYDIKEDYYLSQMPAAMLYLGETLKFFPSDPHKKAYALKVIMDCNDVLMEVCRYNGSSMWTKAEWKSFEENRLKAWFKIFEEGIQRSYLAADELHIGDLSAFALWGNMRRCLPQLGECISKNAPKLGSLLDRVQSNDSLNNFLLHQQEEFGDLYCGGQIEASIREMLQA